MKIDTCLITLDCLICKSEEAKKDVLKKGFTSIDVTSIVGIDLQDDGAILISRENWKRLEIFMAILSCLEIQIDKSKLEKIV